MGTLGEDNLSWAKSVLPEELLFPIEKLARKEDRSRKIAALLLLREALRYFGLPEHYLSLIKRTSYNKPFIDNCFHYNISDSEEMVLLALSHQFSLGIDIEYCKPIDYLPLVDYFHKEESKSIVNSKDPLDEFYDTWTRKEAVLKSLGTGLQTELRSFNARSSDYLKRNNLTLTKIPIVNGYSCHLCYSSLQAAEISVTQITDPYT